MIMMVSDGWGTYKGPKRARKTQKYHFFIHCASKNAWIPTKFEMEVPYKCNYHHAKICGPP